MHQKHTSSIMVFHTSVLVTNPKLGGNETLGKKKVWQGLEKQLHNCGSTKHSPKLSTCLSFA